MEMIVKIPKINTYEAVFLEINVCEVVVNSITKMNVYKIIFLKINVCEIITKVSETNIYEAVFRMGVYEIIFIRDTLIKNL